MSAHPTHTTPQDDPTKPPADPHGYRAVLHDLIGMGAGLARLLHAQANHQAEAARAAVPPPPTPAMPYEPPATTLVTLTNAFDRISRAVRRCIALAERLAHPPAPARDPAHTRTTARKHILRAVEDTIHRAANEGDRAETLRAELRDRLDTPDLDWDFATRPIPDIIAEITRDLGLATPPGGARPWPRRTPADLQDLHTRAAAPSGGPQPIPQNRPPTHTPHRDDRQDDPTPSRAPRPNAQPPAAAQGIRPINDPPGDDRWPSNPIPSRAPQPATQPAAAPQWPQRSNTSHAVQPWAGTTVAQTQPAPAQPGTNPPDHPADLIANSRYRPARDRGQWRPPPGD